MKSPVWIAGGTTEGRKLAHYADCCHIRAYVSVATDYGASLVTESPFVTVVTGRMDEGEMETFLREHAISQVIDATHPYATAVTANIRQACAAVGVPYRCRFWYCVPRRERWGSCAIFTRSIIWHCRTRRF